MPKVTGPTNLSKADVAAFAAQIRRTHFLDGNGRRKSFQEVLENLDGKLKFVSTSELVETLAIEEDKSFVINLSQGTSAARDNFTVAHELGHYFMHTDFKSPGRAVHTRRGSNRKEWEANWFAADLLMPRDEFLEAAKECGGNVLELAQKFGVSSSAAEIRLSSLGWS